MITIGNLKFSSIDYIQVVDKNYCIIFNSRFDSRVNISKEKYRKTDYINKNYFLIYPSISKETSSIVESMTTGEITVRKNQNFVDYKGNVFATNNVTVPITREGKIVGVFELSKDITTIDHIENKRKEEFDEVVDQIKKIYNVFTFENIITKNKQMIENIDRAKALSKLSKPTLIYGETGTGKEVFAQAMINYINIPRKKVIALNCASVPENLVESILFGTVKGVYTGAENRKGLFEEADGGILFLDELNSIPFQVQGKLLRVLQDGSFRALGSNTEKKVNVKVIAAMNIDPLDAIKDKQLRNDLFYRLSGSMIKLLPLRERKDDIEYYIKYYINEFNKIYDKNVEIVTDDLHDFFMNYEWNGNVRELKNVIDSMVEVSESNIISIKQLPAYLYDFIKDTKKNMANNFKVTNDNINENCSENNYKLHNLNLKEAVEETEREIILRALKLANGNQTKAGKILGIPRQTLKFKIDKLNITYI